MKEEIDWVATIAVLLILGNHKAWNAVTLKMLDYTKGQNNGN